RRVVLAAPATAASWGGIYLGPCPCPKWQGLTSGGAGAVGVGRAARGVGCVWALRPRRMISGIGQRCATEPRRTSQGRRRRDGTSATGGTLNPACATKLTGCGMLYRLSPSGAFTVLYNFEGTTADHRQTPIYPYGALLQASDGNFYGTTSEGASVYRMTPGGSVTTITFLGGGSYADLIQGQDGNLYGTTALGGEGRCPSDRSALCHPTPGEGTVFRVSLSGGLTTLKVFSGGADGARPYGGLVIGPDGAFYGTTRGGGAGQGTVFRITSSGAFSTIHTFDGSDGSFPYSRLTVGGDGNLYGATTNGGGGANAGV